MKLTNLVLLAVTAIATLLLAGLNFGYGADTGDADFDFRVFTSLIGLFLVAPYVMAIVLNLLLSRTHVQRVTLLIGSIVVCAGGWLFLCWAIIENTGGNAEFNMVFIFTIPAQCLVAIVTGVIALLIGLMQKRSKPAESS